MLSITVENITFYVECYLAEGIEGSNDIAMKVDEFTKVGRFFLLSFLKHR